MKIRLILYVLALMSAGCKNSNIPNDVETTESDTARLVIENNGPSIYETITAPTLDIDSASLRQDLIELLKFTNKVERDGNTSFYDSFFFISKDGNLVHQRRNSTPEITHGMLKAEEAVMKSIKVEKVASMVGDGTKIDYDLKMSFSIYDNQISFKLCGAESKCFLKYRFERSIK